MGKRAENIQSFDPAQDRYRTRNAEHQSRWWDKPHLQGFWIPVCTEMTRANPAIVMAGLNGGGFCFDWDCGRGYCMGWFVDWRCLLWLRRVKMRTNGVLLAVLLVSMIVSAGGCVAVAVGAGAAGTVAYLAGDLEAVESRSLADVYEATLKALEQLELSTTKEAKDALSAVVIARDAQDKKITIRLRAPAEGSTKISIRVGVFGDEAKSRLIYQKIRDNLYK
jgi:hypothetical protein